MALSLKGIGQGIGRGFKRAGKWVGDEFNRVVAPIHSAATGDWRGAASGLGRNIKRAGQAGALFGKDKLAGVDVDILGAGGGAIEGGLGPSRVARDEMGDTGEGGFAGAARGALGGFGGVKGAQAVHNIGERLGINQRISGLRGDGLGPQAPIETTQIPRDEAAYAPRVMSRPDLPVPDALAANIGSGVADGARDPAQAGDFYPADRGNPVPGFGYAQPAATTGRTPHPAGDFYPADRGNPVPGFGYAQPAATPDRTESDNQAVAAYELLAQQAAIGEDKTRNPRTRPFQIGLDRLFTPTPDFSSEFASQFNNIGKRINGNGNDEDPRSIWRKGLDYAGDNPDVVISALGDMFSGDSGMNEYYRRMAGVQERAQALREKQDEYESDRERLREQFLLRGPTSRWA